MDARRYDRNADMISQIMFHTEKLHVKPDSIEAHFREEMIAALHRALIANDMLGKMTEKGLI